MTIKEAKKIVKNPITWEDLNDATHQGKNKAIEQTAAENGLSENWFNDIWWELERYIDTADGMDDFWNAYPSHKDDWDDDDDESVMICNDDKKPVDLTYDEAVKAACDFVLEWFYDRLQADIESASKNPDYFSYRFFSKA